MRSTRSLTILAVTALILSSVVRATVAEDWWLDISFLHENGKKVDEFFGSAKGSYFTPGERIADQVTEGLGGAPNPEVDVEGGLRFFSAHRPHSSEGAGVMIEADGDVVYAGLVHFNCATVDKIKDPVMPDRIKSQPKKPAVSCDRKPSLTIFTRSKLTQAAREMFKQWAHMQFGKDHLKINVRTLK